MGGGGGGGSACIFFHKSNLSEVSGTLCQSHLCDLTFVVGQVGLDYLFKIQLLFLLLTFFSSLSLSFSLRPDITILVDWA